jgi:hypothetical protein
MRIQVVLRTSLVASAAFALAMTGVAGATQDPPKPPQEQAAQEVEDGNESTMAQGAQTTPGVVMDAPQPAGRREPYWDFNAGYEGDSNDMSYGFLGPGFNRPINDRLSLVGRLNLSHLRYEFENGLGGRTEVTAPGISPAIGLRYGRRNWVRFTTGVVVRREERTFNDAFGPVRTEEDTRVGLSLGADAWWNVNRRANVHAMLHYGAASSYIWSRLAAKHQVSNFDWRGPITLYLGAEGVAQGNDDIRSYQIGPLAELNFAGSDLSLTVRGGYKRSTFEIGESDSGPYFGVGLWKRF